MNASAFSKYLQTGLPLLATLRDYRLAWLSKECASTTDRIAQHLRKPERQGANPREPQLVWLLQRRPP